MGKGMWLLRNGLWENFFPFIIVGVSFLIFGISLDIKNTLESDCLIHDSRIGSNSGFAPS